MPVAEVSITDRLNVLNERSEGHLPSVPALSDEWERRQDSEPAIFPSLLFTEEEVRSVNWDAVFAEW